MKPSLAESPGLFSSIEGVRSASLSAGGLPLNTQHRFAISFSTPRVTTGYVSSLRFGYDGEFQQLSRARVLWRICRTLSIVYILETRLNPLLSNAKT